MKTLTLYYGTQTSQFQFDPSSLGAHKNDFLTEAKKAAASLTGKALEGEALVAFESNVERWMNKGFEGHFSLAKALETNVPKTGVKLIDVRTVGHEVELGFLGLRKGGIDYGDVLAQTAGMSTKLELASGIVTPKTTDWPLMKITADGVSEKFPGKGHVEIVFGPVNLDDHAEIARRGRATSLFTRACSEQAYFGKPPVERKPATLTEAIGRYNALLGRENDRAEMAKYKLTVTDDANLDVPQLPTPSVQTNVEIPLRKLGDVNDTTVLALFGAKETEDKAMFIKAREEASRIVDTLLRPTASTLHGGKFDEGSIKLDKLRSTLTLSLMFLGKVDQFDKEHWPFLPKTGSDDVIRSALSVRDKLTLFAHTSDPLKKGDFYDALIEGALAVNGARGRVTDESMDLEGQMRARAKRIFTPGNRPDRYGAEDTCYGTIVDRKKDYDTTATATGKDLEVGMDYTQKLLVSQQPKIVVELRRSDNGVNGSFEHASKYEPKQSSVAKTPMGQQPMYQRLVAAAAHGPERPHKTEL